VIYGRTIGWCSSHKKEKLNFKRYVENGGLIFVDDL